MCYWPYNHLQQQAFHIPMKNQQDNKKKYLQQMSEINPKLGSYNSEAPVCHLNQNIRTGS